MSNLINKDFNQLFASNISFIKKFDTSSYLNDSVDCVKRPSDRSVMRMHVNKKIKTTNTKASNESNQVQSSSNQSNQVQSSSNQSNQVQSSSNQSNQVQSSSNQLSTNQPSLNQSTFDQIFDTDDLNVVIMNHINFNCPSNDQQLNSSNFSNLVAIESTSCLPNERSSHVPVESSSNVLNESHLPNEISPHVPNGTPSPMNDESAVITYKPKDEFESKRINLIQKGNKEMVKKIIKELENFNQFGIKRIAKIEKIIENIARISLIEKSVFKQTTINDLIREKDVLKQTVEQIIRNIHYFIDLNLDKIETEIQCPILDLSDECKKHGNFFSKAVFENNVLKRKIRETKNAIIALKELHSENEQHLLDIGGLKFDYQNYEKKLLQNKLTCFRYLKNMLPKVQS